jgi:DNA-binding CsgD family transcriptional regulator
MRQWGPGSVAAESADGYGQRGWERFRRQRSREGGHQLCSAYEAFDSMGAEALAERARIELRATGGSARKRVGPRDDLTAQEALIARLASGGASNPEIAAQLFLSPATITYHLRKVFAKLGISSRSQLASALPAPARTALPASSPAAASRTSAASDIQS